MKSDNVTRELLAVIRQRMKREKYTYADAAQVLNVSLPTAKRIFRSSDLTISRISRLAEWLDLTLRDLFELSIRDAVQTHSFTEDQERFFASHPSHLAFLIALHSRRISPDEIARRYKLSRPSMQKYLNTLDKMGLIEQHLEGRVKVLIRGSISWSDDGPLGRLYSRKMILSLAERIVSNLGKKTEQF